MQVEKILFKQVIVNMTQPGRNTLATEAYGPMICDAALKSGPQGKRSHSECIDCKIVLQWP